MASCGLNKQNMKRTDKEIIEAMTFIKEQHNGELPYQFGTFECAKMMAKYLNEQFAIHNVVRQSEQLKCLCCDGKGIVEGEHYDDKQSCLTCNGRGYFN
jgi:hypothetical protein